TIRCCTPSHVRWRITARAWHADGARVHLGIAGNCGDDAIFVIAARRRRAISFEKPAAIWGILCKCSLALDTRCLLIATSRESILELPQCPPDGERGPSQRQRVADFLKP